MPRTQLPMNAISSTLRAIVVAVVLSAVPAFALDPSLQVSQYAHTAWRVSEGFSLGAVFSMAQTPDGYLWLGSEFGLFRFDGVRFVRWRPPQGGPELKGVYTLLASSDGTLWIGTFAGLWSSRDGHLTRHAELDELFVTSMIEDREHTVFVGAMAGDAGRLCSVRAGHVTCSTDTELQFGKFVWSFHEDDTGALWVGADSGLWRWKPDAPRRYPMPGMRIGDLSRADTGALLIGIRGKGLAQLIGDKVEPYVLRSGRGATTAVLSDHDVDSNKLLRDGDGGLWIGTEQRGLVHVNGDRADTFTSSDGLSGNIICSLFEDRERNVWVATTGGLDRFRELPVRTYTSKQGLPTDAILSIVAAGDGAAWLATRDGLVQWKDGQPKIFRKSSGLPDDSTQSLFEDAHGRLWVFTRGGLAYLNRNTFVAVPGVPSDEVFSISGDPAGNVWLSGTRGLTHVVGDRVQEHFPWSTLDRHQQAKVVLADQGGVWLSFWTDGGVLYFKDGKVRASYTSREGLGAGHVPGIELDSDGALWASTEGGGLSRIKDGRVRTLTTRNGLPCDTVHRTVQDESRALWVYAACGLFRIPRTELDAWIAAPEHRIASTLWDAADGVQLRAVAPTAYGPPVARFADGLLWFLSGEGIQAVDPRHLQANTSPPPVHVERLVADRDIRWEYVPGTTAMPNVTLPAHVRDVQIDYAALSLAAPEKVRFKYRLEDQDGEWREVVNERHVQYSNLRPGPYRFRVMAANKDGLWNTDEATLEFSIAPAYYQTLWFRLLGAVGVASLIWAAYHVRVHRLRQQFELALEARIGERMRIARDLHDTLLQTFHGVLLSFQAVSDLWAQQPERAKKRLDAAIGDAAKAITEGRDVVQGLRDSTTDATDIASAISALGQDLAGSVGAPSPAFGVTVEGQPRPLHPILRDDIYKIAAEALRNALRHAEATRIDVEIRYAHEQFQLRVHDDGKGFDAARLAGRRSEGHYGLPGMRERASLMGGTLVVWSKEGTGTAVELGVPAVSAYVGAQKSPWWSRAFGRSSGV